VVSKTVSCVEICCYSCPLSVPFWYN